MHPLLLRFREPDTEEQYAWFALPSDLRMLRTAALLGAIIYGSFAGLDFFLHANDFAALAWVRLAVVAPFLLGVWAWTYLQKNATPKVLQWVAFSSLLVAAAGNFILANIAELAHFYLVSITTIVLFLGYTITGIRFERLLWFGVGILAAFQFYGLQVMHVDLLELGYEDIILFCVNAVGVLASYVIERSRRFQFLGQLLVEEQKNEIEQQNEEIRQQNEEINTQKEDLEEKHHLLDQRNRQVMSSITYAKRIQRALLPEHARIGEHFPMFFAFFRPKDVVSGDFYWFAVQKNYQFLVLADCTGHGVPGGFMTMIGNMLLQQIIADNHCWETDQILHQLDQRLAQTLHRKSVDNKKVSDGMDMAICRVDQSQSRLQFAGARQPLWRVRQGQIDTYKGDRVPIGSWGDKAKHFTAQEIDIQPGDTFYMTSDGMPDQFGGGAIPTKYTAKRLRQLVTKIADQEAATQETILSETFDDWRGKEKQLDDVLILGFRPR